MINTKICPESSTTQQMENFMDKDTTFQDKNKLIINAIELILPLIIAKSLHPEKVSGF